MASFLLIYFLSSFLSCESYFFNSIIFFWIFSVSLLRAPIFLFVYYSIFSIGFFTYISSNFANLDSQVFSLVLSLSSITILFVSSFVYLASFSNFCYNFFNYKNAQKDKTNNHEGARFLYLGGCQPEHHCWWTKIRPHPAIQPTVPWGCWTAPRLGEPRTNQLHQKDSKRARDLKGQGSC